MSSYNKIKKTDLADGALYEKVNDMVDTLNADKIERSQVGIRKGGTAYKVGDKCFCEYHGDFLLECTTAGTSAVGQLDTSGTVTEGATRTDGSVVWTFRSVATKKELNDVKNSSLDKTQITNCITKIPQDIKLELNNGTLTLKAGSKVYVPNGVGVFDTVTTAADYSLTYTIDGKFLLVLFNGNQLLRCIYSAESGSSPPAYQTTPTGTLWYDTTNNICKRWSGTSWVQVSLPFSIFTVSNGTISSIEQVFNGFGYIGSTVFALPGVKGLIPNGRNADGGLKNIEFEATTVKTTVNTGSGRDWFVYSSDGSFNRVPSSAYIFDVAKNKYITRAESADRIFCLCGTTTGDITSFTAKDTFRAVDYDDMMSLQTSKQDTLVSGTNIKTVNGQSLLGSGDVGVVDKTSKQTIDGDKTFTGTTSLSNPKEDPAALTANTTYETRLEHTDKAGNVWSAVSCKEITDARGKLQVTAIGFEVYDAQTEQTKASFGIRTISASGNRKFLPYASEEIRKWVSYWSLFQSGSGIDIAIRANDETYTCPADGWVAITSLSTPASYVGGYIYNQNTHIAVTFGGQYCGGGGIMPVFENNVIVIKGKGNNQTIDYFRFYPHWTGGYEG